MTHCFFDVDATVYLLSIAVFFFLTPGMNYNPAHNTSSLWVPA